MRLRRAPARRLTGSALILLSSVRCLLRYNCRKAIRKLCHGAFKLTQPALHFVQILLVRAATRFQDRVAAEVRNAACSGLGCCPLQTSELLLGKADVHESCAGFLYSHSFVLPPGTLLLEPIGCVQHSVGCPILCELCHSNALKRTLCSANYPHSSSLQSAIVEFPAFISSP